VQTFLDGVDFAVGNLDRAGSLLKLRNVEMQIKNICLVQIENKKSESLNYSFYKGSILKCFSKSFPLHSMLLLLKNEVNFRPFKTSSLNQI
jgi:hypothetical protein